MSDKTTVGILVNGKTREMPSDATVQGLLGELRLSSRWVIVEVNGEVLARERHVATALADGDRVEIVQAVAGG